MKAQIDANGVESRPNILDSNYDEMVQVNEYVNSLPNSNREHDHLSTQQDGGPVMA